jgi:GNAT superfamily N-acetyltransferase
VKRELAGGYELDDALERVDVDAVHDFIANHSYWAPGRPYEVQEEFVRGAVRVVGAYHESRQVGFARAIGDSHFLYLADVYVLPEHRGHGLGVELVREMIDNGPYADSRWILHTQDAHGLYEKFGFGPPSERVMERPRRTGAA